MTLSSLFLRLFIFGSEWSWWCWPRVSRRQIPGHTHRISFSRGAHEAGAWALGLSGPPVVDSIVKSRAAEAARVRNNSGTFFGRQVRLARSFEAKTSVRHGRVARQRVPAMTDWGEGVLLNTKRPKITKGDYGLETFVNFVRFVFPIWCG
jgi:hypothetical protein